MTCRPEKRKQLLLLYFDGLKTFDVRLCDCNPDRTVDVTTKSALPLPPLFLTVLLAQYLGV
jgi:hypothetical protein